MSTDHLLTTIEGFLRSHEMSDSAFGRAAVNDWKFVRGLREGRRIWPETEAKVRSFMRDFGSAEGGEIAA